MGLDNKHYLVDNAFAAPRASGCGESLSSLIDPVIDAKLGLPSPAGHNTAILQAELSIAIASEIQESE